MRRRTAIKIVLGASGALVGGVMLRRANAMPVIFLAHGSPQLLDDVEWVAELRAWADDLPHPTAVLMLSAHWEARPVALGATTTVPLVYDFYGFPRRYYETTYAAPGAPALAARVRTLLAAAGTTVVATERGLDHGFALGRALAPLRAEGVLIVGSGFLTHNLRMLDPTPRALTPAWAAEFDAWAADVLARRDVDALLDYRARAPGVALALPTHEHFAPVVAAAGAATTSGGAVTFPITGFRGGSLTRRSVQFG